MIKAKGHQKDGRPTYFIGLSFGNLDRFRSMPGDTYIQIPMEESGLGADIVIFSGRTESEMTEQMAPALAPDATIRFNPMSKN